MGTSIKTSGDRILFVQWMGDYREAYNRLASGGPETYYAQRDSMDRVANLVGRSEQVGVLCCVGDEPHDEVLGNGVRSMCAGISSQAKDMSPVLEKIKTFRPTHVILGTPETTILEWALRNGVEIMAMFADSFEFGRNELPFLRRMVAKALHQVRTRRLIKLLNDPRIRCVSNHNMVPCEGLVRLGVDARKVVPWDFAPSRRPEMHPPREAPAPGEPWRLLFVGSVVESKGIGDAIQAVALLRDRGRDAHLRILGDGQIQMFKDLAQRLGVSDRVVLEGRQGNDHVIAGMLESHLVLVPSHRAYPEGLPFVIKESFSTRTPVVCSDHPMFIERVHGPAAEGVPERNPDALADAIERVLSDPDRYWKMSEATQKAWERVQVSVNWHEPFLNWLDRSGEGKRWLAENCMASRTHDAGASRPRSDTQTVSAGPREGD